MLMLLAVQSLCSARLAQVICIVRAAIVANTQVALITHAAHVRVRWGVRGRVWLDPCKMRLMPRDLRGSAIPQNENKDSCAACKRANLCVLCSQMGTLPRVTLRNRLSQQRFGWSRQADLLPQHGLALTQGHLAFHSSATLPTN